MTTSALAVNDYVGTVTVGDGWGLVLGDQPSATTWFERDDQREGALVRGLWADRQDDILQLAAALPFDEIADCERLPFCVRDDSLVLFDSVLTGIAGLEASRVRVRSRSFLVGTRTCKPDARTAFILHEFYRQPN